MLRGVAVQMMRNIRMLGAVFVTGLLLLTGCSVSPNFSGDDAQAFNDDQEIVFSGEIPEFTGPWAESFTLMYQRASSDFEREILKDEEISDLEFSEMRGRFTECLAGHQITNVKFFDDGGLSFEEPSGASSTQIDEWVEQCSIDSGESGIGALYSWIRRNPENLDEHTIMAACLVRKQAVDPGYSASNYAEDVSKEPFPFLAASGAVAFQECSADPLGLFE